MHGSLGDASSSVCLRHREMFIRLGGVALRRGSEVLLQRVMVGRRIRLRRERTEFIVVWLGRTYTALESSATLGRSAGNARRQLLVIGSQLSQRLRRLCIECRPPRPGIA